MHVSASLNPWVKCLNPLPAPSLRLFCLPYAGGGTGIFRPWLHHLPRGVEICPIQLPGREDRWRESPFTRLDSLVQILAQNIQPFLDVPFACFGHSMGALIAFELARQLRSQQSPVPIHLFLSGRRPPHLPNPKELHTLPDQALIQELRQLEGTPQQVLDNPDFLQLLLPTLRADFAVCETYTFTNSPPLAMPISVFGGLEDPETPISCLQQWHRHTSLPSTLDLLPGNHFFIHTSRSLLLKIMTDKLNSHLVPSGEGFSGAKHC